jgi:hypothetical protein
MRMNISKQYWAGIDHIAMTPHTEAEKMAAMRVLAAAFKVLARKVSRDVSKRRVFLMRQLEVAQAQAEGRTLPRWGRPPKPRPESQAAASVTP